MTDAKKRKSKSRKSNLPGWLTDDEAAEALGLNRATLANWRVRRIGPPPTKIGKNTFYREDALKEWIISQERDPSKRKKK
jgi:hypothetical protein